MHEQYDREENAKEKESLLKEIEESSDKKKILFLKNILATAFDDSYRTKNVQGLQKNV